MHPGDTSKAVVFSEKVFQHLLAAYPPAHREEYGAAMAQLFRDQCRDAWSESRGWGLTKLWLRVLPDVVGTSFLEHLESIKERKFMLNRIGALFRAAQSLKFLSVFTAVFLLTVITATVVTFMLPETYRGIARIALRKTEDSPAGNPKPAQPAVGDYDQYFIQTEFELMQSQVVLDRVVKKLGLNEKWGVKFNGGEPLTTAETTELVRRFVDLRPVRSTSLVEIHVYRDTPDEAANIANAMAEAYQDYRVEKDSELERSLISVMKDQLHKQENDLNVALAQLDQWRKDLNVADSDPLSTGPSPKGTNSLAQIEQAESPYWRAKEKVARLLEFRNHAQIKIASAEADLQMPGMRSVEIPVEILDWAIPNPIPVRPNKPLNILIGIILGTVLGLLAGGTVTGISLWRRRNAPPKIAS